jgi:hypothetical protein
MAYGAILEKTNLSNKFNEPCFTRHHAFILQYFTQDNSFKTVLWSRNGHIEMKVPLRM